MSHDSILIGAGPSGLAAGIRLARSGRRVLLLERHEVWGGLSSFYSREGHRLDVGLHALTNFAPAGTRGAPLTRILRQLDIAHEELDLREQGHSEILFPDARLVFANDPDRLAFAVANSFPEAVDGFARLVKAVRAYVHGDPTRDESSGRAFLADHVTDPLLVEMLHLPLFLYGSADEDDMDLGSLVTLFRAVFLEGLARPRGGARRLLNLLVKRFKAEGGELRTRCGVRRIHVESGSVRGVELDDGTHLEARHVLSSAGLPETLRLAGMDSAEAPAGRISVLESISILDAPPLAHGHDAATSFFSTTATPSLRCPEGLVESGVGAVAVPNNFQGGNDEQGTVRLTTLASFERWNELDRDTYTAAKERAADEAIAAATTFLPDWRPRTVYRDVFTPKTIRRFTDRIGGAIYGSPAKRRDGETGIEGLQICGADQGFVGVVGALFSGILMATRYAATASS